MKRDALSAQQVVETLRGMVTSVGFWLREMGRGMRGDQFLSQQVKAIRHKGLGSILVQWLEQWYYPSLSSLVVSLVLSTVLALLAYNSGLNFLFGEEEATVVLAVLEIGIAVIIFPSIVFIIGLSVSGEAWGVRLSEVLLKHSAIFPIMLFVIFSLVHFLWAGYVFGLLVIVVTVVVASFALFRTIKILLSEQLVYEESVALLKQRIGRLVDQEICLRLGNKRLLSVLREEGLGLEYSPWLSVAERNFQLVRMRGQGVVTDVNLTRLRALARQAGEGDPTKALPVDMRETSRLMLAAAKSASPTVYLLKNVGSVVDEHDSGVVAIAKEHERAGALAEALQKTVHELYIIEQQDEVARVVGIELQTLKEQVIQSLSEQSLGRLKLLLNVYVEVAEAFLQRLKGVGATYSLEAAGRERQGLGGACPVVQWLYGEVMDVFHQGMRTRNKDIIERVGVLPLQILTASIRYGDHYVFQEFLQVYIQLYRYLLSEEEELREFMFSTLNTTLQEVAETKIGSELQQARSTAEIANYRDFVCGILFSYQELMNQAFEARQFSDFRQLCDSFYDLLRMNFPTEPPEELEVLERSLQDPELTEEERSRVKVSLALHRALVELDGRKSQVLFGLASVILHSYRKEKRTAMLDFYQEVTSKLPCNLGILTELFLSCDTEEARCFWHWRGGEEGSRYGQIKTSELAEKLTWCYCCQALSVLSGMGVGQIERARLVFTSQLESLVTGAEPRVLAVLQEVESQADELQGIVSGEDVAAIPSFRQFLTQRAARFKGEREEQVRSAALSEEKIQRFKEDFRLAFQRSAVVRQLAEAHRCYVSNAQLVDRETEFYCVVYAFPRESLIAEQISGESPVIPKPSGTELGRLYANSEDACLLEHILEGVGDYQEVGESEGLIDYVELGVERLSRLKMPTQVILCSFDPLPILNSSRRFVPLEKIPISEAVRESGKCKGGLRFGFSYVPLLHIPLEGTRACCLLNLGEFARLIQYAPFVDAASGITALDIFSTRVLDLNEEEEARVELLAREPEWLKDHDDKEGCLRNLLLVEISEKLKIQINNKMAVHTIRLREETEEET